MSNGPGSDAFFGFMQAALAGEKLAQDSEGRPAVAVVPLPAWQDTITPARMKRLAEATIRRGSGKARESKT